MSLFCSRSKPWNLSALWKTTAPFICSLFDDSCPEICNSKELVDLAPPVDIMFSVPCTLNTSYSNRRKLGGDVELKNTHIVLLKSPRDVHQIGRLSVQLGLGSTLIYWYRDATSVSFRHLLTDLSRRKDDRIRYCTINRNIPSEFYVT